MDPPDFSTGGRSSPKLQGPRPTPLKVNKDSHKIRKPPVAPQLRHPQQQSAPSQQDASTQNRQTVVIYTVSPKVIHTTVNDFMSLVQRLTGPSPRAAETSTAAIGAGDVSPAARLASIEKAISPSERERERDLTATISTDNIMEILEGADAEMSQIPGILTPEPATLPPIPPAGLFSPAIDPFLQGGNMFITSPSILFPSPIISPNAAFDLFNPFFDF
ncbi:hypothetical protein M9H77_12929 [Catharanthus roseus]|uniref:Uncharacterized protein n=1 Tax=Catharanthus roseus TaxID=4058 RepID=A0ACC0BIU3_CATRO|nr:hypothetical protein M9H77_12929 [Catharanthus roseus]